MDKKCSLRYERYIKMNKLLLNVVPFILNDQFRNIKAFHHYTVEEVLSMDLFEVTELALLVPGFLQPEGWKFQYSWAEGDVKTISANPEIFKCPTGDVIDVIVRRIENEGYALFNTVRNHYLFLEWDWEYRGCVNNESFLSNIKKDIQCCHALADLYYKEGGLFVHEWDLEIMDFNLVPLSIKSVSPSSEALLGVLDFLAKEDVLKVVVK